MSTISRRPHVKSITSTLLVTTALRCVEAVTTLVDDAVRALDAANGKEMAQARRSTSQPSASTILPASVIVAQLPAIRHEIAQQLSNHQRTPLQLAKLEGLLTLQSAPFVCDPALLQAPIQAVASATTETAVLEATHRLLTTAATAHCQVMADALVLACRHASIDAGFPSVETSLSVDGRIRVIASDDAGRALVTEIHNPPNHQLSLETEVVGVTDGSCVAILDKFDRALMDQGVSSTASERKWTGGVCELGAAKDLLQKVQASAKRKKDALQRARKLNSSSRANSR